MKRFYMILICAAVLLSVFSFANAAPVGPDYSDYTEYTIDTPCYLRIHIPWSYTAYWRNMPSDSPVFLRYGGSPEEWNELFEKSSDVLYATDQLNGRSILISIEDEGTVQTGSLDDQEMKNYIRAMLYPQGIMAGNKNETFVYGKTTDFNYIKSYFTNTEDNDVIHSLVFTDNKIVVLDYIGEGGLTVDDMDVYNMILSSLAFDESQKFSMISYEEVIDAGVPEKRLYSYADMDFYIPDDYIVYDHDTEEGDLLLAMQGLSLRQLKTVLDTDKTEAIVRLYGSDFTMSIKAGQISNQEDFIESNEDIGIIQELTYRIFVQGGLTVSEKSMIDGSYRDGSQKDGKLIWLKYRGHSAANNIDEVIYTTIWNHVQYTVTVMAGSLDQGIVEEIDKIIESTCACK